MDRQEKAFEFANDANKQLISLSVGSVALTITFAKDVFGTLGTSHSGWLLAGWIVHIASVLAGLLALLAQVGVLEKETGGVYSKNIAFFTACQWITFLTGLGLLVVFAALSAKSNAVAKPAETPGVTARGPSQEACSTRGRGALITVAVNGESVTLWSVNELFIAKAKEKLKAKKSATAMFEKLIDGYDCDPQWSWHVDPEQMSWPSLTTEVCDGRPSDIEREKQHWITGVKRYCPWTAVVTSITDCRSPARDAGAN